jgi:hypothetical protein
MSDVQIVRRAASITGVVLDAVTKAPIAGALVAIAGDTAGFKAMLDALAAELGWSDQVARPDRRLTAPDGLYYFVNLPAGSYDLQISVPRMGTRYGSFARSGVQVLAAAPGAAPAWPPCPVTLLQPTCVTGLVSSAASKAPIAGAQVWLRGDTNVALTNTDGTYALTGLVVGAPGPGSATTPGTVTVEVSAGGFQSASLPAILAAGQAQTVNAALEPSPA